MFFHWKKKTKKTWSTFWTILFFIERNKWVFLTILNKFWCPLDTKTLYKSLYILHLKQKHGPFSCWQCSWTKFRNKKCIDLATDNEVIEMLYQHHQYFENIQLFYWLEQYHFSISLHRKRRKKSEQTKNYLFTINAWKKKQPIIVFPSLLIHTSYWRNNRCANNINHIIPL